MLLLIINSAVLKKVMGLINLDELFEQGKLLWIVPHPCCSTKCGRGWKSLLRHRDLYEGDGLCLGLSAGSPYLDVPKTVIRS
uniref:Uncharacterized protein n=1 Tax=Aegilops tauschii subsp. strangulata TaxID=200361 RepID=A0A453B334_AEGTS